MRILIVSQYFWPESFLINDLAKQLTESGHEITVLTGKPNYPDGDIYPGYKQEGSQIEFLDKVEVLRVPLRARGSSNAINLILNYLSFVFSGIRNFPRLVKGREFDTILVFAPSPITSAIPAIWLKKKLGIHLAVWVQDLWPESLSATGFIHNKWVLRSVGLLVRWIYRQSDTLLIQSEAFRAPVEMLSNSEKIFYYPNSILRAQKKVVTISDEVPSELKELFRSNFCVVFAGNLGKAQALETIVEAAERLIEQKDVKIVLVGSGSMLDWVFSEKQRLGLSNLIIAGRFSPSVMPSIFQMSSALLVSLKDEDIFNYTIPSKVQSYLASAKPVIAAVNGETARVINSAKAGISCQAEDPDSLVCSIQKLYRMSDSERMELALNGGRYFEEHFEMSKQAERLVELLENRIMEKREVL